MKGGGRTRQVGLGEQPTATVSKDGFEIVKGVKMTVDERTVSKVSELPEVFSGL